MDIRAILMGLAFAFMWSSAFTSARMIVADAPPIAALSLRFLISGLIGVGIALALGQSWRLTPAQWRATVIFGICQNALYLGLNFVAMQTVEASLAAIIASTLPLMVAVAAWAVFRETLRPLAIAGLVAGFAGAALIMGSRLTGGVDLQGVILCVLGAMALTLATLSVRGATSGGNVLMIVGLQMLIGSAALAPVALLTETLEVNWTLAPRRRLRLHDARPRPRRDGRLVHAREPHRRDPRRDLPLPEPVLRRGRRGGLPRRNARARWT